MFWKKNWNEENGYCSSVELNLQKNKKKNSIALLGTIRSGIEVCNVVIELLSNKEITKAGWIWDSDMIWIAERERERLASPRSEEKEDQNRIESKQGRTGLI